MPRPLPEPETSYAAATPQRLPDMARLLLEAGLPADDLASVSLTGFELALDGTDRIVGMAGVEMAGDAALLRSVAVAPERRGLGLGQDMVARREAAARAAGVNLLYLLTTSADDFFRRLGYADVARNAVPAAIAAHAQFRSLCPASAKCLGKRL